MAKVGRRVVARGSWLTVSCAVREDGSIPGWECLESLKSGMWPMPDIELPDEAQASFYFRMLADLKDLSDGLALDPKGHNRLNEGIWELKRDVVRLTIYDTPGDGSFTPKLGARYEEFDGKVRYILEPDELDEHVRIGHAFSKDSQKTPERELHEASCVREEDLSYDKADEAKELNF